MNDGKEMNENIITKFSSHEIVWNAEKAGRLWEYYGGSLAHRDKYFGEQIGPHLVRVCKRMGLFKEVLRIIDFSCGTGAIIEALCRNLSGKISIFGFDPSATSIHRANERNRGHSAFAGAYEIKALPSKINDGTADLVLLTEVIEHLDDSMLTEVLKECRRILSPGGKLIITTPNEEDLSREKTMCPECGCIFHRWQHQRRWSEASLIAFLGQIGFSRIRTRQVAWGNEIIDFCFTLISKKKAGILAIAQRE
jgi:2-polyprenyl-3-methyl-5-hydroxy-6-metoxy-1,4-benzoquinol methylase